jgi:hypothetical protein
MGSFVLKNFFKSLPAFEQHFCVYLYFVKDVRESLDVAPANGALVSTQDDRSTHMEHL